MSDLRFVCISDLHLGAPDSVLTSVSSLGRVSEGLTCETLVSFAQALRETLKSLKPTGSANGSKPSLILLGDILDLGLSPMGQVATVFGQFVDQLFPRGQDQVFDSKVLIVPGNHDHHLWRMAQDEDFLAALERGIIQSDLIDHNPYSPIRPGSELNCRMLTAILRHHSDIEDASVHIAYPNLCLINPAEKRAVVMHHGHFIDPMYRLMTTLYASLNGKDERAMSAEEMERQNGAWVDFLWSDLGSAGDIGRGAFSLYELMGSASAAHNYASKLSDQIEHQLFAKLGISGSTPIYKGITAGQMVRAGIEAVLTKFAEGQRNNYLDVLPETDLQQLRAYLDGPVKIDLNNAIRESGPPKITPEDMELSFIFGHTHKPYEREVIVDGFSKPVAVYNTGGWVVDQPTASFTQGAAAMFIDEALNVASLRVFDDPVNSDMPDVRVQGLATLSNESNAMVQSLRQAVIGCQVPWAKFSAIAKDKLQKQADLLLDL